MFLSQTELEENSGIHMQEAETILAISGVRKSFPGKEVLKSIDLTVSAGQLVALVGNNGQGKTTLMKLILGLLSPDGGKIHINGEEVKSVRTTSQKALFGYLPESTAFYPNLTGRETLRYLASLKQAAQSSVDSALAIVGLENAANYRVNTYSKGMKQRLGLAQALLGGPKLLLLDEPTNGLDPSGIHEFYQILCRLKTKGVGILMSSHLLAEIEPRSNELVILKDGVIAVRGSIDELISNTSLPSVIKFQRGLNFNEAQLSALLQQHSAEKRYIENTQTFEITCLPANKQPLLLALLSVDKFISKLIVNDPGLEQLFLQINRDLKIT
ncbi:ABC transporter ATP-binding protein [Pseudomonadota bacterium]